MALRFGPKQAIDAFLPAQDGSPDGTRSDPREPPHPEANPPVEPGRALESKVSAQAVQPSFSQIAPARPL
jgi:hypothetical protein